MSPRPLRFIMEGEKMKETLKQWLDVFKTDSEFRYWAIGQIFICLLAPAMIIRDFVLGNQTVGEFIVGLILGVPFFSVLWILGCAVFVFDRN